jgi:hypothetical protein
MNWSLRYAVTKKSLRHIQNNLPKDWVIASYGQPSDEKWLSEEQRNLSKPDIVRLVNKRNGNTCSIYDHSNMLKSNPSRAKYFGQNFWNFSSHGEHIKEALSSMDMLPRQYIQSGIHLDLTRNNDHYNKYRDERVRGWVVPSKVKAGDRIIYVNKPDWKDFVFTKNKEPFIETDIGLPYNIHQGLLGTVMHEMGHIVSHQRKNLQDFASIRRHYALANPLSYDLNIRNKLLMSEAINLDGNIVENTITSPSIYGFKSTEENYAENFAHWMHPTSPISNFTYLVGNHQGWPMHKKIEEMQ